MKKYLLGFVIIAILILFFTYNKKEHQPADVQEALSEPEFNETTAVTPAEIQEAEKIISDYFDALETSSTVILTDYVGYNMITLGQIGACNVNSSNKALDFLYDDNFKPKLIKIEKGSKHSFDPQYYIEEIKNQQNIDIYKIMNLRVYFDYNKEREWDFILVKYKEGNPWKIHLWVD